jgi:hypothetical protein
MARYYSPDDEILMSMAARTSNPAGWFKDKALDL